MQVSNEINQKDFLQPIIKKEQSISLSFIHCENDDINTVC